MKLLKSFIVTGIVIVGIRLCMALLWSPPFYDIGLGSFLGMPIFVYLSILVSIVTLALTAIAGWWVLKRLSVPNCGVISMFACAELFTLQSLTLLLPMGLRFVLVFVLGVGSLYVGHFIFNILQGAKPLRFMVAAGIVIMSLLATTFLWYWI